MNETFHWLQPISNETDTPDGKVFLFFKQDECDGCPWRSNLKDEDVIVSNFQYIAFGYDSYQAMVNTLYK